MGIIPTIIVAIAFGIPVSCLAVICVFGTVSLIKELMK